MSTLQQQAPHSGERQLAIPARMAEDFRAVCRDAWKQGLLSGCNGNASLRLGEHAPSLICITRSGASKGRLTTADCCLMDVNTGTAVVGGPASTESGMHLAIYRTRPDCTAILHTHPRRLLALSLRLAGRHENFLRLPLFEAEVWRARLGFAPALPPGTTDLAEAVAAAARDKDAVWMAGHGLCCLGRSLGDALCLAEELEHLAALQILATV
ncbi:MAG: class II aldolase/adducin family protein [Desulfovibrio sp.]|uniref:class II aldolase/adducin family protein n=1 Tax=Desulfovibrio sp. TaxID=885 RepID=UPI00135D6458|nr:class II aldolase/adducin family protein [Desulfovibrio sp.]MTJ94166.1 class II aldolase/adducin family protein [Desulfovibrio sp.]